MLLLANPEAAQCANEDLIHQICRYTEGDLFMSLITLFGINEDALQHADTDGNLPIHIAAQHQNLIVIDFFLSIYPEAVSISNNKGDLPIHYAAQSNTLAIIIHLLNIYPESSSMTGSRSRNILHYAMERSDEEATEIARYIFTRYPDLIHGRNLRGPNDWYVGYQRNSSGYTPFLLALAHSQFILL
jgi:ankyrin repeat protein